MEQGTGLACSGWELTAAGAMLLPHHRLTQRSRNYALIMLAVMADTAERKNTMIIA